MKLSTFKESRVFSTVFKVSMERIHVSTVFSFESGRHENSYNLGMS